jgi:hypothetical protein
MALKRCGEGKYESNLNATMMLIRLIVYTFVLHNSIKNVRKQHLKPIYIAVAASVRMFLRCEKATYVSSSSPLFVSYHFRFGPGTGPYYWPRG